MKQLIVRVEAKVIQRLKIIAAVDNESMATVLRVVLDNYILIRKQDPAVKRALEAAGL